MGCSSSGTAPVWVLPRGAVLQEGTGCSSVGPPWGHKPCQQTCSSVGSSLHGATGPARSLLQTELLMGSQPPSGILLLPCGPLAAVTACPTTVCSTGCRGTSAPGLGAPPALLLH